MSVKTRLAALEELSDAPQGFDDEAPVVRLPDNGRDANGPLTEPLVIEVPGSPGVVVIEPSGESISDK